MASKKKIDVIPKSVLSGKKRDVKEVQHLISSWGCHELEVQESPLGGLGCFAGKDYEAQDYVARDISPAADVMDMNLGNRVCCKCYSVIRNPRGPRGCERCGKQSYCDKFCSTEDSQHLLECDLLDALERRVKAKPTRSVLLLARCLLARQSILKRSDDNDDDDDEGNNANFIDYLINHKDKYSKEDKESRVGLSTMAGSFLTKKPINQVLQSEIDVLYDALCSINCNAFTIIDCVSGVLLGTGLYPGLTFINHSCDPNLQVTQIGKILTLKAVRPIKKGEEFTISYIDRTEGAIQRNEELMETFFFECQCHKCASVRSEKRNDFYFVCKDPSCKGRVDFYDQENLSVDAKCMVCSKGFDDHGYALNGIRKSIHDDLMKIIQECYKSQRLNIAKLLPVTDRLFQYIHYGDSATNQLIKDILIFYEEKKPAPKATPEETEMIKKLILRVYQFYKHHFGESHPDTAKAKSNYLISIGKLDEAKPLQESYVLILNSSTLI
ncbi:SET domain-containing protein [Heterostelium album PN500]|uniref:SET domain-containing protein n=1 Tax=Heterostelium pallidum (strain ATCC 26659 / Pp 5 / PN500) TaxID=670386 RepID=D3BDR6_HETP5|nr:SET domain-containing protein [Heterostelium album PN500]EFA80047.1 SET domain-containing protein [Heterostelium album PN500]|eukprot:XP_020432167.1 SET domain-containing protein [Heterostelium album PN500]